MRQCVKFVQRARIRARGTMTDRYARAWPCGIEIRRLSAPRLDRFLFVSARRLADIYGRNRRGILHDEIASGRMAHLRNTAMGEDSKGLVSSPIAQFFGTRGLPHVTFDSFRPMKAFSAMLRIFF
jgi:hypothetical protein